jgi:photosynthetic reaction center cytochrome c subunit
VIARDLFRLCVATATTALVIGIGVRAESQGSAQGAAPQPGQAPAAPAAQTAVEKYKNIQILKTMPADQLPNAMQYIAASLGVQCQFCHVQGQFESDDRPAKLTARKMIQMVNTFNSGANDITMTCATCHHGRSSPERTPPLATDMTPEEARLAQLRAVAGRGGAGPEGRGGAGGEARGGRGGAPAGEAAATAPAQGGQPGRGGRGEGRGPARPSETIDQIVDKYVQAMGGQNALSQAKTLVMQGTATTRDLQTYPITVQEKATGEYRIDIQTKPAPTSRGYDGKHVWVSAFGNIRELEGVQAGQATRLADFGLPLAIKQRYSTLTPQRYGNVDGTDTIIVSGRSAADVTEQLQFDRKAGLLLRRTIVTRTALGNLIEQVDYSDYRDAAGITLPFQVRYAAWNQVSTQKYSDVKVNAPVEDAAFAKPVER